MAFLFLSKCKQAGRAVWQGQGRAGKGRAGGEGAQGARGQGVRGSGARAKLSKCWPSLPLLGLAWSLLGP